MIPRQQAWLLAAVCVIASLPLRAASVRTANFIVSAGDANAANQIADACEAWREYHFREWWDFQAPPWDKPAQITVHLKPAGTGGGGATSFAFWEQAGVPAIDPISGKGVVDQITGTWEGPLDKLLSDVIPHEVLHAVNASMTGRPIPRWFDEGLCMWVESDEHRLEEAKHFQQFAQQGRLHTAASLHSLKEYPRDILPLYAQGYMQVEFLHARHGRAGLRKMLVGSLTIQDLGYTSQSFDQAFNEWLRAGGYQQLHRREAYYEPKRCQNGMCIPGRWLYRDEQGRWVPFGHLLRGPVGSQPPKQSTGPAPKWERPPLPSVTSEPPARPAPLPKTEVVPLPPRPAPTSAAPVAEPLAQTPSVEAGSGLLNKPWMQLLLLGGAVLTGGVGAFAVPPALKLGLGAIRILGGLRRRKQSAPAVSTTLQEDLQKVAGGGASAPSFPAVVRRDATEAAELLNLLHVEGQNPHLYAYIGTAVFEELDRVIHGPNGPERDWALSLKQRLHDRVNKTLPVIETLSGA